MQRLSGTVNNSIRAGAFYKFIAPSRFGKGIAMEMITELGNHIEEIRQAAHVRYIESKHPAVQPVDAKLLGTIKLQCQTERPSAVFLTGGNVLQTQYHAAVNGGCGMIIVNEIKNGKVRYVDHDGSYGSLLTFYDKAVHARTFRQAEAIPAMKNCRMQLIAAGVKDD